MPREIHAFFSAYRDAFNRLDGEAVAALYAVPSGIADDTGYEHWPTLQHIERNMVQLCRLYRENGYQSAVFQPASFIEQGPNFAVADVAWTIVWSAKEPSTFNTTYNLMRTADGWRVLLATAYSEKKLSA